ncbi:YfbU family protein [Lonsdalea quercina]|uniref:YfbU family protein n=1 Tax=Lonsdalea quercina TaxID=71657 RepID=UPI003976760F
MKYTQQEKLQTMMLCEIYKALDIQNSFDPDLIREALSTDQYWAIDWEYPSLDSGEGTPEDVQLFVDTYDMYNCLKYTYEHLDAAGKDEVARSVPNFNEERLLNFPGFGGNNETNYLIIGGLLKTMGRFSGEEDLTKNSHMPSVDIYKRMLQSFLPARDNRWVLGVGIPKEDLINTLNERVHPPNR